NWRFSRATFLIFAGASAEAARGSLSMTVEQEASTRHGCPAASLQGRNPLPAQLRERRRPPVSSEMRIGAAAQDEFAPVPGHRNIADLAAFDLADQSDRNAERFGLVTKQRPGRRLECQQQFVVVATCKDHLDRRLVSCEHTPCCRRQGQTFGL